MVNNQALFCDWLVLGQMAMIGLLSYNTKSIFGDHVTPIITCYACDTNFFT